MQQGLDLVCENARRASLPHRVARGFWGVCAVAFSLAALAWAILRRDATPMDDEPGGGWQW